MITKFPSNLCVNINNRVDGQIVFVGIHGHDKLSEAQNLKENDVITVMYSGVNVYNKLIQPIFYRKRKTSAADKSWKELVEEYQYNVNKTS